MKPISLNGNWRGTCFTEDGKVDFTFDGCVPGCVHTDLMGKKIPKDLFYRNNADECQWIENRDFEYSRSFELEQIPKNAKLVFSGLDVYADVYLNGKHIGYADDMFIKHSFSATDALIIGENTLTVHFYSPTKRVAGLPLLGGAFTRERMRTRRIQCTYGWDWVARFVTMGIWRDVYLEGGDEFSVKDAYIYTDHISDGYASIIVEAEFENYECGGYADMRIVSPRGEVVYSNRFYRKEDYLKEYIAIPNAELWYPIGYGAQPLYKLIICDKEFTFGIRTAKILELPDENGSPYYNKCLEIKDSVSGKRYDRNEDFSGFTLLVNDIPIMCKGANWVPSEPFPSAETDEKITTLLELAKEAGVNMIRVWGGGIFEKQHFYNECDRLGILVTQDFLMACGIYPENEDDFIEKLKKEAEFAARELRNHPSLVWWSGDNENAVEGYDSAEDYHGRTAIHKGIYPTLKQLDHSRRLLLSSPYGGTPYASKTKGTTHNTQYLGCSIFPYILNEDMKDYKEHFSQYLARFIAEEPTTGAICLPSLLKFMTEDDIYYNDDMWNYHTKSNPALPFSLFYVLLQFTKKVLGGFEDGKDRYFKMKYVQYEWVRITLENIRRNRGFSNGIVYWMWNDCWPASSGWAFVDYYCLPKASYYSFKRCSGSVITSIDKHNEYEIYLCNDTLNKKSVNVSVSYLDNGILHKIKNDICTADRLSSRKVLSFPINSVPSDAIIICEAFDGERCIDRSFYKNGPLPIIPTKAVKVISRTDNEITVTADSYVHAVEFEGEYIFDDNYFSLLPGEVRTVSFRKAKNADTEDFTVAGYTIK